MYISVDLDKVEMSAVRNDIDVAVSSVGFNVDCVISCKKVEQDINRLNPGKSDGNDELKTNHSISEGMTYRYIYHYFYLVCLHVIHFRKSFLLCTVTMPKGKESNLINSANCRGIVQATYITDSNVNVLLICARRC